MSRIGSGDLQQPSDSRARSAGMQTLEKADDSRQGSLLEMMKLSPFIGVVRLNGEGHVKSVSTAAAEMLFRTDSSKIVGRSIVSTLSKPLWNAIDVCLSPGEVGFVRIIIDGWQLVISGLRDSESGEVELIVQRMTGMVPESMSGHQICFARAARFGPLNELSDRELEVAAWIGMGLSIRLIAERLGRSVKTIENHRISIGRKLGVSDRLDIALIAFHAGLRPSDYTLIRV